MSALTPLGIVHTAISLVAVGAGIVAFARHHAISPQQRVGQVYIWATVLTCLTGFFIFQHGGFGKPHALGVLTLLVLGLCAAADRRPLFGRASPYVVTVGYSLTFFFHMVPALTETFTRLPAASPLFSSPEDPALQQVVGVFFLLFVVGAVLQVRQMRKGVVPAGVSRVY